MDSKQRYDHFVDNLHKHDLLYTLLEEDGTIQYALTKEYKLFRFWSSAESAEACKSGPWADSVVTELTLEEFENEYVEMIEEEEGLLDIESTPHGPGFVVALDELVRDLLGKGFDGIEG